MMEQVNCMLGPLYSDSLNMITSVKATFCSFEIDIHSAKFSCSAKKKSIWRSRQVPWSRSRVSHKRRTSSGWPLWHGWVWMKSLFCRFLVTFITSTFNISSFCIALYLSISLLENLHVDSGTRFWCLVNYWNPGDLTAFFLLFSQIYGLYEAIYKVDKPANFNLMDTLGVSWPASATSSRWESGRFDGTKAKSDQWPSSTLLPWWQGRV